MARDRRFRSQPRREGNAGQFSRRGPRSAGLQTGIARAAGETPIAPREEARRRLGAPTSSRHRQPEAGGTHIALHPTHAQATNPGVDASSADRLRNSQSTPATARSPHPPAPPQRGAARPQRGVRAGRRGGGSPSRGLDADGGRERGAEGGLQRGADPGRSRGGSFSVELGVGFSVEFPPADPATAWSSAASAWSCPGRSRYSVELTGSSVEFPPTDPASAWSWAPSAWS